jgi:hypothetical protein
VTFVRDPIERALSQYFHEQVSRRGKSTSSRAIIMMFRQLSGNEMLNYIRRGSNLDPGAIIGEYDFVGVSERMLESMVVLKHVLQLPSLCDILFTSAKNSSGPAHRDDKGAVFVPRVPLARQPTEVQEFVSSSTFRDTMLPDARLYAAANATLDRRIRDIGADAFSGDLSSFQDLLGTAQAKCGGRGGVSLTSEDAACYWNDNGCGYPCLDTMCGRHLR